MEIYLSPWILLPHPSWIIFLLTLPERLSETANEDEEFDQHFWNEKRKRHLINEIVDIALSETQIPYPYSQIYSTKVSKAFNVRINAWNITAALYSNGDRTSWLSSFSWRFFLIHLKEYEMSQACYCCWFNWRNSITCTHCNVTSLEHYSIPQQATSQRINVDPTAFHILCELFMIIKIFSSKFELDWEIWLPKTNQIWTVYALWGC